MFLLVGCKTEIDSEAPAIIGVPPEEAYLGVEYGYNFGATDKDDILNYSLTNAPSWLALEDTTNKARQGIIMRGVPGITGGRRGRADLGRTTSINLVANDRASAGIQPFSVDVQENLLSVVSRDYSESGLSQSEGAQQPRAQDRPDSQCELPFTGSGGEHSYTINLYDESGGVTGTANQTSPTRPVLVQLNLDQPSVTRISVAFELRSNFDPNSCDQGFSPPHQHCDTGLANADEAIIGRDIVGLGSGSGGALPLPPYLTYQPDNDGLLTRGLVTLEPGITECYVRLEVIDDLEPERLEAFTFALTEVRSGIAGLGPSNSGVREPLRIEDNEPTVSLQTRRGGKRDAVNLDTATEYTAVISGDRTERYFARITSLAGTSAIPGADFSLQVESFPGSDDWRSGNLIEFPVGTDRVGFRVVTVADSDYNNPAENDLFLLLDLDTNYQAGRSNHAASNMDDELRISINELNDSLKVGSEDGFVPTDMAMGHNGRVFIAGYDSAAGNQPTVRVVDQKGNLVSEQLLDSGAISPQALPVIATGARNVKSGDGDAQRYEFAVAFGVARDNQGNPTPDDVNILTQRWFFDAALGAGDYARDWQLISGSEGNDLPRWIGIAAISGNVLVSGVTQGRFEAQTSPAGGFQSFVQRIDTRADGANLVPVVAWTRQVGSTGHDEQVLGGGVQNSSPIVIGDSSGAVAGQPQFGGKDAFFYSVQGPEAKIEVQQVGTGADENLTDGFFDSGSVWLVGNGNGDYRVTTEQGIKVLRRTATDSPSGFLLGYTPAGSAMEAYLVNDGDDQSTEFLQAAMVFDSDLIAAGSTTGVLIEDSGAQTNTLEDPSLFRRNRQPRFEEDEDDDPGNDDLERKTRIIEPAQEWDQQVVIDDPGRGSVQALTNYRDDEITVLIRRETSGGVIWTLNLFSAEGDPLNSF